MNTKKLAIATCAISLLIGSTSNAAGTLSVDFDDPKSYTDIEMGAITTDKDRQYVIKQLRETFAKAAERYLPDGYAMSVTVKDVDLAGDQDPLYSPNQDIRVYKDIYAPRIKLAYHIADMHGETMDQGSVSLSDLYYLWDISTRRKDVTYYVSKLIADWMRRDIGRSLS